MRSVVIVGAGAAGLVAAGFAAAAGARTTLLERTANGGRKILISGGGRCNVLPSALAPERFVTDSPAHLLRAMLRSWPFHEQRAFFENGLGLPLALEEDSGKLFPRSNRAADVRDALVTFAQSNSATIQFDTKVSDIVAGAAGLTVVTSSGAIGCGSVVLATGGLSVPATGSDGIGLAIARRLGHEIVEPYPALTPLLGNGSHETLAGVSLDARLRARIGKKEIETRGGFLFTHRGYSGPSVLDISHVTARGGSPVIRAQWSELNAAQWERVLTERHPGGSVAATLARHVPARLGEQLMAEVSVPADRRTSSLTRSERLALIDALTAYRLPWTGNEGFKKAEVTGGGVKLTEVDSKTLESKRLPGLYLCGEMLDAFGPIGGHNFSWAWATGRTAGLAAARRTTVEPT